MGNRGQDRSGLRDNGKSDDTYLKDGDDS